MEYFELPIPDLLKQKTKLILESWDDNMTLINQEYENLSRKKRKINQNLYGIDRQNMVFINEILNNCIIGIITNYGKYEFDIITKKLKEFYVYIHDNQSINLKKLKEFDELLDDIHKIFKYGEEHNNSIMLQLHPHSNNNMQQECYEWLVISNKLKLLIKLVV